MKTLVTYVPGRNNYNFDFFPRFKGETVNLIEHNQGNRLSNLNLYSEKLAFARSQGYCNLSIVGYGEPLLNRPYLEMIDVLNNRLNSPFGWVELKTNGSQLLNEIEENRDIFNFLCSSGIKTIVLYLTAFDDFKHHQFMADGSTTNLKLNIKLLCEKIKEYGFNLRLEIFLTKWLEYMSLEDIVKPARELKADQITLRKLLNCEEHEVNQWIKANSCQQDTIMRLQESLEGCSIVGYTTSKYPIYSVNNMSFVLNDGTHLKEEIETLYLLPNARLYRKPDDLGSLLF